MKSYSDYGHFAGLAGAGGFLLLTFVCVVAVILLLLFLRTPQTWNRVLIGALLATALLCLQFMFAVLYSFEIMHIAGTIILALVTSIVLMLPPLLILTNPVTWRGLYFRFRCCCFWKEGKRQQPLLFQGSKIDGATTTTAGQAPSSSSVLEQPTRKISPTAGSNSSNNSIGAQQQQQDNYSLSAMDSESGENHTDVVVRRHPQHHILLSPRGRAEANNDSAISLGQLRAASSSSSSTTEMIGGGGTTSGGWYYAAESRSTMTPLAYWHSTTDNKIILTVGLVAVVLIELILHLMLSGGCGCLYPMSYTTWASRSATRVCSEMDSVCHVYTTLGHEYNSLLAMGHMVTKDKVSSYEKLAVSATFCPVTVGSNGVLTDFQLGSSSFSQSTLYNCTSAPVTRSGRWVPSTSLKEDIRYVGIVPINPLLDDTIYQVRMDFTRHDTNKVYSKRWYVRSLPSPTSNKNITFIAGGDFQSGSIGKGLLRTAINKAHSSSSSSSSTDEVHENDARFASLGGDLAYENNIRYCYDRVDTVLNTFSTLRRSDGTFIPLVTAVGNHEAGGYLTASANREQRQQHYYFYARYFPTISNNAFTDTTAYQSEGTFFVNGDFSVTYHHHIIGRTAWIVLDSGIMFKLSEQTDYLDAKLAEYKALVSVSTSGVGGVTTIADATVGAPLKGIVVVYHNPAFPSGRPFTDSNSVNVRNYFVKRMDSVSPQVRWVLEHHDHLYKRTKMLKHGVVVGEMSASAMGTGGTVYSGDGSLGVHMSSRHGVRQFYHAAMEASNYVLVATLDGRGDADVPLVGAAAYNEGGSQMDSFYV